MAFVRRKEQRTDYRKRLRLLIGRKNRVVIRKSLNGFNIQIIKYKESSDETVTEVSTKHLKQHGWKGHGGNLPSAYLTGFLFGKIAIKKGFDEGIIDLGLQSKKSQALFAVALGIKDAGFKLPTNAEISEDRLKGGHIAKYAEHLKKTDADKYKKQFSAYLKNDFNPEKLPEHFDEIKKKIEEL